jgi:hypothetical protein
MPVETRKGAEHHGLVDEVKHLHEIAEEGNAGATPAIALGEVILFLLPVVLLLLLGSFLAYYIA